MNKFEQEVKMNRPRLALAELVPMIEEIFARISDIEDRLSGKTEEAIKEEVVVVEEEPKKAPAKSRAKKAAATKD